MSFWNNIGQGVLAGYGYNELMDNLKSTQSDVNQAVTGLQTNLNQMTNFTPWGVRSNIGNVNVTENGLQFDIGGPAANMTNQMRGDAGSMFGYAAMDPRQRQQSFYDDLQAARQPGFDQAYKRLQNNLWSSGRSGLQTDTYGGTGEQYAFGKALADSQLQDRLQAQQMAQSEQLQQANIGNQMLNASYVPMQQLAGLMNYGINNQQLQNQMQRENASLWTQLGLGGLTANTNFENIRAGAFGDMISALTPVAGNTLQGAADYLGEREWGQIWNDVSNGNWSGVLGGFL